MPYKDKEKHKAYMAEWYQKNKSHARENSRRNYRARTIRVRELGRVSRSTYDSLLVKQGGRCAICNRSFEGVGSIDHDHATKKIRGLLCSSCNLGLGKFGDKAELLRAAAAYLEAQ